MSRFFFQAEDGIRDGHVTGVQTCALPICLKQGVQHVEAGLIGSKPGASLLHATESTHRDVPIWIAAPRTSPSFQRSEERRVGKEGRSRGGTTQLKNREWVRMSITRSLRIY